MKIGYACLTVAVEQTSIRTCILKNAQPERLLSLAGENIAALERMIDYNIANHIMLYRISSDIIPFGSSLAAKLPWRETYSVPLCRIAEKIHTSGMRVSMHPGQYTVLNSPDLGVVSRAVEDLAYHAHVLNALDLNETHKIVLHVGGKYGNTPDALSRFASVYRDLDASITRRLILENDGSIYTIAEVLALCSSIGAPAVYDNLHNAINPVDASKSDAYWIEACRATWFSADGAQKTHYSQQHPAKVRGAHSDSIAIEPFLVYIASMPDPQPDIMLEVKDKNRSAIKCILSAGGFDIRLLEAEWGRYKYAVLERSPQAYQEIRNLLKHKQSDQSLAFYRLVELALAQDKDRGRAVNALEHVWGYFKESATPAEAKRYVEKRDRYLTGSAELNEPKRLLYQLAQKYRQDYLLGSYYFTL